MGICIELPLYLLKIYTDFIFRDSNDLYLVGIIIDGHSINNLRIAEDIALITKWEGKLQTKDNCVKE